MDQFDTLKREATKLERSLEDKVSRYQQVSGMTKGGSCIFRCNLRRLVIAVPFIGHHFRKKQSKLTLLQCIVFVAMLH
jgi:hypothetical protein